MDGLSQDEINALLAGMDLSDDDEPGIGESSKEAEGSPVDLTQAMKEAEELLTDVEKDAVGEVANISMGSSATTLYSLVNKRVNITTPVVEFCTWDNLLTQYERPCVFIQIKYTVGLDGTNILILKEHDVKVITDLMMGGDGTNTDGELGELHLSAISEAMNQMMGASATSLSTMMGTKIDISPPEASLLDLTQVKDGSDVSPFLGNVFVKISFKMQIEDLVDSSIMQLYPVEFARKVVDTFMSSQMGGGSDTQAAETAPAAPADMGMSGGMDSQAGMNGMGMNPQMDMSGMGMNPQMMNGGMSMGMNPQMDMSGMGMNPQMGMNTMGMNSQMNMNGMGMNPQMMGMNPQMMNMGMGGMSMGMNPQMGMSTGAGMQNINVQPAQFQGFTNDGGNIAGQENIGLIMDVPLNVTVELGRTSKLISEILDFAPGTIIELDRIAGEPIDVLVNGKFVAKGEVVVIEESFGVRVTEIIK
ncbi:MAG: flagellar motor switch phosphatase FliY [Lachnospiraceae bacterium]|nr:flagellar motor switch phosphatase FliY [Lachnospiraceae bacterium]